MSISPPNFWGRPAENTVKQGASDTPPPKFGGGGKYGLTGKLAASSNLLKFTLVCSKPLCPSCGTLRLAPRWSWGKSLDIFWLLQIPPQILVLRTRRPGKKWVSGLRPEIGKNSSRDWSRNWPRRENREKLAQNPENPNFSPFFPIFQAGPILGPISGAIFSYFGPKPIFYLAGSQYLCVNLPCPYLWNENLPFSPMFANPSQFLAKVLADL